MVEVGQRFGELEVISCEIADRNKSKAKWNCKCHACGQESILYERKILRGTNCGCVSPRRQDLTGRVFGRLTVLHFHGKNKYAHLLWWCRCECGNEKAISGNLLRGGTIYGCSHCTKHGSNSSRWTGVGELGSTYWRNIQKAAERKNITFEITKEQAWEIFLKQDRKCALTGEELRFTKIGTEYGGDGGTASMDRIDNTKGYSPENIQWVNRDANIIKLTHSMRDLWNWCNLVVNKDNSEYSLIEPEYKKNKQPNSLAYKMIGGRYWSHVISSAKKRDIELKITQEDAYNLFIEQGGRCAITNKPIFMYPDNKDRKLITASIDRINSDLPYEISNVRWIHRDLNLMKWHLTDERFIEVLTKIYYKYKDKYGIHTTNQENN